MVANSMKSFTPALAIDGSEDGLISCFKPYMSQINKNLINVLLEETPLLNLQKFIRRSEHLFEALR